MAPRGMCFLKFRRYVDSLPPEKPTGIEVPWPVYGAAEMRMSVPELDGAQRTFPICGFDLTFATRPNSGVIVLTTAPRRWPDEAVSGEIELEVTKFLKANQPPPVTADDINAQLAEASRRRK